MQTNSPASICGVDVLDRDERARRRREDLGQSGELERNVLIGSPPPASQPAPSATASTGVAGRADGCAPSRRDAGQRRDDVRADAASPARRARAAHAVRGRGSSHRDRRAERGAAVPAVIGTMRSESRIASSTLLVIMIVVTGRSPARAQLRELLLQGLARQRVERAERLVEKQHLRLGGERARDRDALPHAARQLPRPPVRARCRGRPARASARACARCSSRGQSGNAASTASRTFSSAENHGSSE